MTRTKLLLDIQALDLARDRAVARLGRVVAALRGDAAVRAARGGHDEAKARLAEIEKELTRQTLERRTLQTRIAQEEQTLYGGQVRSPKEVQNLQREVASVKRRLAALDDLALEQMLVRDEAQAALDAARAALDAAEAAAAAANESLSREKAKLTAEVRRLDAQRVELAGGVSDADRQVYERLRKGKPDHVAVAELRGETCGGCGMLLARNVLNDVAAGDDLHFCGGCGRILHG
jgi:predicted  nucleic acid-binding Zn-ribbon protein